MRLSLKASTAIATLSTLAITSGYLFADTASAKPIVFSSSYVGAGIAAGVTNGGQTGDAATFGGNIQGRLAVPNVPVSVRGAVLFTNKNSAIMPMLTYDLPVANNTNVYAGAGYSFVQKEGQPTPLGNRNAAVLTVGAEAGLTKNIVTYGDIKWGINAYQNSPADALSFQAGLGYRF